MATNTATQSRYGMRRRQRGQGMTEYIIIVALIAIAAIAAFTYFGGTVRAQVAGMTRELAGESAKPQIDKTAEYAGTSTTEAADKKTLKSYNNKTAK